MEAELERRGSIERRGEVARLIDSLREDIRAFGPFLDGDLSDREVWPAPGGSG